MIDPNLGRQRYPKSTTRAALIRQIDKIATPEAIKKDQHATLIACDEAIENSASDDEGKSYMKKIVRKFIEATWLEIHCLPLLDELKKREENATP